MSTTGLPSGAGREPKFWYIGSKFLQERARFSNLRSDRELKQQLEQLACTERSRLYDLQQEIYAVRGVHRCQKMERWSSRLNAGLAADAGAVEKRSSDSLSLATWIVTAEDADHRSAAGANERSYRHVATAPFPLGAEAGVVHTKAGFLYRPIPRPSSIRETKDAREADRASRTVREPASPNPRELLLTLLGEKFSSEQAIKERITRKHKVDFCANEYTDGSLAFAKRQLHLKKNRFFSHNIDAVDYERDVQGKPAEESPFRLDEKKLKRLQVAHQQMAYNKSLRRVESFLGVAASPESRRAVEPILTIQEAKVVSYFQSNAK